MLTVIFVSELVKITRKSMKNCYVTWEKFGFMVRMVSLPEKIEIFHIFFLSVDHFISETYFVLLKSFILHN